MGKGGKEMTNYEKNYKEDYHYIVCCYKDLKNIVENWDAMEAKPNCPKDLLETQIDAMYNLIKIMETRADTEGIIL
jgi:hypothetical protein